MQRFQDQYSLVARKDENFKIRKKYPRSIPIILWIDEKKDNYRKKYLVPSDLTMAQLMLYFRKQETIVSHEGMYIMINDQMIPRMSITLGELDTQVMSEDGFMYVSLFKESVFG